MQTQSISCPNCGHKFELSEVLSKEIKDDVNKQLEIEKEKILKNAKEFYDKEYNSKINELTETISSKDKVIEDTRKAERELRKKQSEVDEKEKNLDLEIQRKLDEEKVKIINSAKQDYETKFKELETEIKSKDEKLKEAQKAELELRKKQKEIEEREENFELEFSRKLDEEKNKIIETNTKKLSEEHRLKELEKDKKISDMLSQIEDLKRKAEQGSQQTQGEIFELELEEMLQKEFKYDSIEPVSKGVKGGDVVHKIMNELGQQCGCIVWESKRAKNWSDGWVQKLKDDQRNVKADVAILITTVLPKDVNNFSHYDGIWVTNFSSALGLATAIRINLLQLNSIRQSSEGKSSKMDILYNYLAGTEFRQKVEAIVEAFSGMKEDLDSEKKLIMKQWSKREKQIEKVLSNTFGFYGDMQGIMGKSLPEIESMNDQVLLKDKED